MDGRMRGVASRPVLAGIGRTDAYQPRKKVVRADRERVKVDAAGDCVPVAANRVDGVFHAATVRLVRHASYSLAHRLEVERRKACWAGSVAPDQLECCRHKEGSWAQRSACGARAGAPHEHVHPIATMTESIPSDPIARRCAKACLCELLESTSSAAVLRMFLQHGYLSRACTDESR